MKDSPPPAKRRRYDAVFRAEALRLAGESRSTQAAARPLIDCFQAAPDLGGYRTKPAQVNV